MAIVRGPPPPQDGGPSPTLTARVEHVADFFGLDDPWQRPRPALTRSDWIVAASFFVFAALGLELVRSYGLWTDAQPHWVAYTALATITIPLVFRRRHPLLVAGYAAVHMVVIGIAVPELSFQIAMQVAYFYAVYCAVAWSRERRLMLALLGGILLVWFLWVAWDVAYGQAIQLLLAEPREGIPQGILPPLVAVVVYSSLVTLAFLVGAALLGQANWRQARERARAWARSTRR